MYCNKEEEDGDEPTTTKKIEIITPAKTTLPLQMNSGFQLDPISAFLLLPVFPLIYLFNLQSQLMNQMSQNTNMSSCGKVTQITRDGNTLTIIEKYI